MERVIKAKCDGFNIVVVDRTNKQFPRLELLPELKSVLCELWRYWDLYEAEEDVLYVYRCADRISRVCDIIYSVADGRYDIFESKDVAHVVAIAIDRRDLFPPVMDAVVVWMDYCFVVTPLEF